MKLNSLGRPSTGPEKLKQERSKKQEIVVNFVKNEISKFKEGNTQYLLNNYELSKKFGYGKRAIDRYLKVYEIPLTKEELAFRRKIIWQQELKKRYENEKSVVKICKNCKKEFTTKKFGYVRKYCNNCISQVKNKQGREYYKNPINKTNKLKRLKEWYKTKGGWIYLKDKRTRRKAKIRSVIHSFTKNEWLDKLKSTKGICPKCHRDMGIKNLTMDHNPPVSKVEKGFDYTINKVQPLCLSCNSKKQDKIEKNSI